jgi:hypothetical protein
MPPAYGVSELRVNPRCRGWASTIIAAWLSAAPVARVPRAIPPIDTVG